MLDSFSGWSMRAVLRDWNRKKIVCRCRLTQKSWVHICADPIGNSCFISLVKNNAIFFIFRFFLFWNAIVVVVLVCTCLFFSWISLAQSYLSACKFLSRSWTMDYYQCEKPFTIKLNKWSQILKTVSIFIFLFHLLVGIYALAKSRTRGFEINKIHFVWFIAEAHSDTIS